MLMPDDEDEATEVANSEISAVSEIADIQFIPSSFFVDSKGHIVGKLLEGESFEATKNRFKDNNRLFCHIRSTVCHHHVSSR